VVTGAWLVVVVVVVGNGRRTLPGAWDEVWREKIEVRAFRRRRRRVFGSDG